MYKFFLIFALFYSASANKLTYVENPEATSVILYFKNRFERFPLEGLCDEVPNGETKYKNVLPKLQQFTKCLGEINKYDNVTVLFDSKPSTENVLKAFATDCPFLPRAYECFDKFSLDIEECITDERKSFKNQAIKLAKIPLKYLCDNEAKVIPLLTIESKLCFDRLAEEGDDCLMTLRQQVMEIQRKDERGFDFDAENCKELNKGKQCVRGQIEACNIDNLADVFDGLLAELYSNTNCVNEIN